MLPLISRGIGRVARPTSPRPEYSCHPTAPSARFYGMDLKHPGWMYLKAGLFLLIGLASFLIVWLRAPNLSTALLLALMCWAFTRAYYFAFYVITHYIDDTYHYSGLTDFLRYIVARRKSRD